MAFAAGSRLGAHEILGLLGAGGMGEVYLAQDTKLNRRVAIKVLPEAYANDPDRIARFHREAQAVAALNHPGIAAIHEFAESLVDGETESRAAIKFLVLELVGGETLADRLRRGPVPVDEALAIGRQILEALEAAHEKGICHRDLKPANVKVTPDGGVKVLDFGLAKFLQGGATASSLTHSPTMSLAGTMPGVVLGTAGYMSPEQAKGFEADQRSDIFSFGCILYELLTRRAAFEGETVSETLAGVLKTEVDFSHLPPRLNPRLVELLRRCLEKNPKKRWHAAGDVRVEIEAVIAGGSIVEASPAAAVAVRPLWKRLVSALSVVIVSALAAGYAGWTLKPDSPRLVSRFAVILPEDQTFTPAGRHVLALSRDGANLVYVANNRLYLRPISGLEARAIPGSETMGAIQEPAFSPDGQWVAFRSVSDSTIRKIPIGGGTPISIGSASQPYGISWDEEGVIFGQLGKGIVAVSPDGGVPEVIVTAASDEMVDSPERLPGGRGVLFSLKKATDSWDRGNVVVQRPGGERTVVVQGGSDARYVPTGHLVYATSGVLFAVPFDVRSLTTSGGRVSVVEGVRRAGSLTAGATSQYAVSDNGSLAFLPGPAVVDAGGLTLAFFDGTSPPVPLQLPSGSYAAPRVSPDGKWVAVESEDPQGANILLYELSGTSSIRRLTFGGTNRAPVWSSDSRWVAFQSNREGDAGIFQQRADGTGTAERLTKPERGAIHVPDSWSPDGGHLLFTVQTEQQHQLWSLDIKNRRAVRFSNVQSATLVQAVFSPDGRWVAYQSRELGVAPVTATGSANSTYVEPFPPTGAKYLLPVSAGHPYWSRKGDRLMFENGPVRTGWVPVTTAPVFAFGKPTDHARGVRISGNSVSVRRNSDAMPDGRIIGLMPASPAGTAGTSQITIVLNWFDELRARVR